MIRVKINKNIIFFFSILAELNPQKKYHSLGEVLLDSLDYEKINAFQKFKEIYKNKNILTHPYQFSVLSINTKNDLSPKSINPECGFGEKTLTNYKEIIEPLVKEVYKKSDFEKIYKEQILEKYEELTKQIQKSFRGRVEDSIKKIWGIENNYKFILIPNFLEINHSFGIFRNNKLYSITSPVMKDRKISFQSQFAISNAIHEFSHSVFQKFLIENDLYQKHKALTENIEIPKKLINTHSNPAIYMEETLIKIMTLLIQQELYKKFVNKEDQKLKVKRKLDQLEEKGYKKARELYSILQNSDNKKERYLDYLSKNI
jgi:hypothetical protein